MWAGPKRAGPKRAGPARFTPLSTFGLTLFMTNQTRVSFFNLWLTVSLLINFSRPPRKPIISFKPVYGSNNDWCPSIFVVADLHYKNLMVSKGITILMQMDASSQNIIMASIILFHNIYIYIRRWWWWSMKYRNLFVQWILRKLGHGFIS